MTDFNSYEEAICAQEKKIQEEIEKLNKLHQSRPAEAVSNYSFKSLNGTKTLLELFGNKDELIVIHNMGAHCSYCTLWADGFNGYYKQIPRRAEFVVISNDTPELQQEVAGKRSWNFPMFSSKDTSFFPDMGFYEDKDGQSFYWPGVSIFRKTVEGKIERTTKAGFGPGDLYSSIWHLFELLPAGAGNWSPTKSIE